MSNFNFGQLALFSGITQGLAQIFGGQQEQELFNLNAANLEEEGQLAEEAGAVDRLIARRQFVKLQGEQIASAAGSGLSGFEDIFFDDAVSFELDQLVRQFNTDTFVANKKRSAVAERFKGRAASTSGLLDAAATGFGTLSILNPPKLKRRFG